MAKIELKMRPKSPIIIEGFPGFGLVGTITTEFLLDHLKTEQIGRILMEEAPAMVAIHENKMVEPLGIFYNKQFNLLIVHAINMQTGTEWKLADSILELARLVKAKEIISIEGVGSNAQLQTSRVFYFTNTSSKEALLKKANVEPLREGIILGVTSAVLLKADTMPVSCVFAETHTNLPDSKAAAKVIEVLDRYLSLKVDPKPLVDTAQKFEEKVKGILASSKQALEMKDAKQLSYLG